ncbi:MAG TPA: tetratricopeptide repeat protein [Holophagaceae bacterium]|nr:tetratricopeptide repeat protein [Holophagaceae bacterium]
MRFVTVFFLVLAVLVLAVMANVYLVNHDVLMQEVVIRGETVKVQTVILGAFLLGFALNLIYAVVRDVRDAIKGLNASAATRLGKRISERLKDVRDLMAHGLPKDAKALLEGILEQRKDHEEAQLLLAEVHLKLGEPGAALKLLETFCQEHRNSAEGRYLLADALIAMRDSEGAIGVLKKLVSDQPKLALRALRRLRAMLVDAARWEEALEAHKKLASQFPSEINQTEKAQGIALAYQVGIVRVEADQYKEAAQIFQPLMKEDPSFVPAYLSLGRCMVLQDQEQQGVEIWLEGFRATGEGTFLQEVEDYFIQLGKPEEGLAVLEKVAATSEHATMAKFFLGKMLYRLEILDRALEQFQEVRSQVVYAPVLFFFMAKIHSRRGRNEAALNEYRQLLRNLGILRLRFECAACNHRTQDYADRCENCGTWNASHFLFKESDLPEGPLRPEATGSWLSLA